VALPDQRTIQANLMFGYS